MFHAFELQPEVSASRKRMVVSAIVATIFLTSAVAFASVIASTRGPEELKPKQVDVSFRPPPPPPEPAKIEVAPPPPPKVNKPKPPPVAVVEAPPPAPVAAPAPAAAAMVAPKEVPKTAAPESDTAVAAIAVAVGGTGDGSGTAVGSGTSNDSDESAAPVIASAGTSGPVNLPEDAEPPEPNENNAQPEYPESARTTGQEAKVVLKIVVELDGHVGRIQVLKGEEPFVSAALAVVKTWTYEPATLDGAPLAVFKIVNITFSLRE
jgi:protein TonB